MQAYFVSLRLMAACCRFFSRSARLSTWDTCAKRYSTLLDTCCAVPAITLPTVSAATALAAVGCPSATGREVLAPDRVLLVPLTISAGLSASAVCLGCECCAWCDCFFRCCCCCCCCCCCVWFGRLFVTPSFKAQAVVFEVRGASRCFCCCAVSNSTSCTTPSLS